MITPDVLYNVHPKFYKILPSYGSKTLNRIELYQSEFISELNPSGHKINDTSYYENIFKEVKRTDQEGKEIKSIVEIAIERVAIPIQPVILEKQLTHACGNNIQFIDSSRNPEENKEILLEFKQGWLKKNMETAKYDLIRSVKSTGDGAFCAVMNKGKFEYRIFSALNGDSLHPIKGLDGKLKEFGRSYSVFDYEKGEDVIYMEKWDNKNYTRYKYSLGSQSNDGWDIDISPKPHGFTNIPIIYVHNPTGACWTPVQDLIDKLEMALSQLFENNKSYAFRIMVIQGGFEIQGDIRGQARAILMDDPNAKAGFMEKADASDSFTLQLEQTLKFILMGSFTVLPPEIKGGDLPGVTIKILYSPAVEKAINDKNFYNEPIDNMVNLFKEGYGMELIKTTQYNKLDIRGEIIPYVHSNDAETANIINTSVLDGSLSVETAAEIHPLAKNDEFNRILKQNREEITGTGGIEEYKGVGNQTGDNIYNQQQEQTK